MHLATKSVNSQVTVLSSPVLFFSGTLNLCLDQAERKQPNSHKHMNMTHSIPIARLQDYFPFFVTIRKKKKKKKELRSVWGRSTILTTFIWAAVMKLQWVCIVEHVSSNPQRLSSSKKEPNMFLNIQTVQLLNMPLMAVSEQNTEADCVPIKFIIELQSHLDRLSF